jgi:hypothetical protein
LSPEEDLFVTSTARGQQSLLALALLVLMFRRLGRFVALTEVPLPVIGHVRRGLRLAPSIEPIVGESTLYRDLAGGVTLFSAGLGVGATEKVDILGKRACP